MENFCSYELEKNLSPGIYIVSAPSSGGDKNGGENLYSLKVYHKGENLKEIDTLFRLKHPYLMHGLKILANCSIEGTGILMPLVDGTVENIYNMNLMTQDKIPIMYKLLRALEYLYDENLMYDGHLEIFYHLTGTGTGGETGTGGDIVPYIFYHCGNSDSGYNSDSGIYGEREDMQIELANIFKLLLTDGKRFNSDFLSGVDKKYQQDLKLLLDQMLNNHKIKDILNNPLFRNYREIIMPREIIISMLGETPPDTNDIINAMKSYIEQYHAVWSQKYISLAINLYHRVIPNYYEYSYFQHLIIGYTCIYIANHFLPITNSSMHHKEMHHILKQLDPELEVRVTAQQIHETVLEIIVLLNGVLCLFNEV